MERGSEPVQVLRRLLERPGPGRAAEDLVATRALVLSPEAGAQAARFAERIRDLSLEERQELFDETFGGSAASPHARLMALLGEAMDPAGPRPEIEGLLETLDADLSRHRNPYHHVLIGLRALLARAR